MDAAEVRDLWEANAEAWIRLSRAGHDVCRDLVNTPAFFRMLPDVRGRIGFDIGCGEGHNTRLVAHRGARVTGLDIAPAFLRAAIEVERVDPRGIRYRLGDAGALPLHDASFDFGTAFMSLMDVPHPELAVREAARVIKPGGFLQFSITHPCFQTRKWHVLEGEGGTIEGVVCGDYFDGRDGEIDEWTFRSSPDAATERSFRIPRFHRTLTAWFEMLADAGFAVEAIAEPCADEDAVRAHPRLAVTRAVAMFLIVRARKPA